MDHAEATQDHTAERYCLGELSAADAEAFELHYFECPQCSLAVESCQFFVEHARQALAPAKPAPAPQRAPSNGRLGFWEALWARPALALPGLAFGAVALLVGSLFLSGTRSTDPYPLYAFQLAGDSRGDATPVAIPAGAAYFSLSADLPPDVHYARYRWQITSGGTALPRVTSPAPAAGEPLTILAPAGKLKPGSCQLTVTGVRPDGQDGDKIQTYSFVLQFK